MVRRPADKENRMKLALIPLVACGSLAYATPDPTPTAPTAAEPVVVGEALEGEVAPTTYVVGPGDRLLIQLWGLQDQTSEADVNAEGRLFVPRVGTFAVGGRSLALLRKEIEDRLHAVYPTLKGSVTLSRPRTFLVHVTGAVARPGTYPATPLTRVSALIPRAGGALEGGSLRSVEVRRHGATELITADLVRFTQLGELDANPTLLDGDTLFVPLRKLTVEITGAVRRPGRYELTGKHDLAELLELAGGRTADAAHGLPLRVTSRDLGDRLQVRSLAAEDNSPLGDGYRVHVPELADLRRSVVVEGAIVGPPGLAESQHLARLDEQRAADLPPREISVPVPFVEGDGVRDLVVKVGGLQPWADARAAYILRRQRDGRRQRIPVDIPQITAATAPDVDVVAGDTLIVPSRRESVMVAGAVLRPGFFQYSPDLHPRDYVNLAGGPSRDGSTSSARVLSVSGESRSIAKVNAIEPGDVITVPERRFSSSEIISITLIIGNIAVSAAALGVAATQH
jgi:protein involved in polysaccharide export with SLBB domain